MLTKITTIFQKLFLTLIVLSALAIILSFFIPLGVPARRIAQPATLILIAWCLLKALPITWSRLSYILVNGVITIIFMLNWNRLQALFTPASYGPNQIIAHAQYFQKSLRGDMYIFYVYIGLLVLSGFIIKSIHHYVTPKT